MTRALLLSLTFASLAFAQEVQVKTDKGTLDVKNGPGGVQVKSKGKTLKVKSSAGATDVQVDKGGEASGVQVGTTDGATVDVNVESGGRKNAVRVGGASGTTDVQVNGVGVRVGGTGTAPAKRGSAASEADLAAGLNALMGARADAWLVDGAGKKLSHTCAPNENVNVTGASNTVTLSGPCRNVWVSGSGNRVTTEQAGAIDASGSKNQVKWKAGLTDDREPQVTTSGFNNSVAKQ